MAIKPHVQTDIKNSPGFNAAFDKRLSGSCFPTQYQRACDEYRRIGADENSDNQSESKVVNHLAAEQVEREAARRIKMIYFIESIFAEPAIWNPVRLSITTKQASIHKRDKKAIYGGETYHLPSPKSCCSMNPLARPKKPFQRQQLLASDNNFWHFTRQGARLWPVLTRLCS